MANLYEDFLTSAKNQGVLDQFTDDDLALVQRYPEYGSTMLYLMADEKGATTSEQRILLGETMSQLRSNYETRAAAEDQAALVSNANYAYSQEGEYQDAMTAAGSFGDFTYDPEDDVTYKTMRQNAIRNSRLTAEDVLTKASVGTGGVPSSYAISAAQQAANQAAGAADDAIPTLYQNALAEWNGRKSDALNLVSMLAADRQDEYERFLTQLGLDRSAAEKLWAEHSAGEERFTDLLELLYANGNTPGGTTVPPVKDGIPAPGSGAGNNPNGNNNKVPVNDPFLQAAINEAKDGVLSQSTWQFLLNLGYTAADLNAYGLHFGNKPVEEKPGVSGTKGAAPTAYGMEAEVYTPKSVYLDPMAAAENGNIAPGTETPAPASAQVLTQEPAATPKLATSESVALERVKLLYPDGVTDADTWDSLEKAYGAAMLEAFGVQKAGFAILPKAVRDEMKSKYPSGVIKNATVWNNLLRMGVTEKDLNKAGYMLVLQPAQGQRTPNAPVAGTQANTATKGSTGFGTINNGFGSVRH